MGETRGEGGRKDKWERGEGWETERDEGEGQKGELEKKRQRLEVEIVQFWNF